MDRRTVASMRFRLLRDRHCLLAVLGLVFYWPMFRAPFLGTVFSHDVPHLVDVRLWYTFVVIAAGFALAASLSGRPGEVFSRRGMTLAAALTGSMLSVAVFLIFGLTWVAQAAQVCALLGFSLLALGFTGVGTCWVAYVSSMGTERAMCCMTVSFLLSFLFGFADMTMVSLRAVCLILPVATSVFLLLAIRVDAGRSGSAGASHDAEMRGVSEQPARLEDRHTRKAAQHALPLGPSIAGYVIAGIAVGLIASACMRALWMYGAGGYNPSASVLPTYVESTFVAFTFVLMAFFSKGPSQGLFLSLIAPLAALIVGIVLCSFADIGMGFGLVATARTSFEFCLIASAVMFAHGVIARWSRLLGALFIIEGVTDLLTHFAIPRFLGVDVDTASGLISVISLTSMLIITLGLIVVAGVLIYRASTQAETVFRFEPSVDAISSAADALRIGVAEGALPQGERAEELLVLSFGLTRREAQIAACLARGNSAKKTAEILCLSAHTVQDYTKSIYSKMGIHSKQSLIDEVNELVGSSR